MARSQTQAQQDLGGYAQSRYNRAPDFNQMAGALGYAGGDVDDDLFGRAQGWIDTTYGAAPTPGVEMAPSPPQVPTPPGVGFQESPPQVPIQMGRSDDPNQPGGAGGGILDGPAAPSPGGGPPPATPAGRPPTPAPTLPGGIGTPGTPPARSPLQTAAQEALLRMLGQLGETPSLTDPTLQPASEAFRLAQERGIGRKRNAMAERMAAQGTATSGGLDTQVLGIESDAADQIGAHDAQLLLNEGMQRRDKLMQAVQLAEAAGEFEQSQNLQRELATLDASLRQQGLDLQASGLDISEMLGLGNLDVARGDLALRGELGRGGLDLNRELGLGGLALQGRGLDLNRELGLGDLNLRGRGLDQAGQLGRLDALLRMYGMSLQNDQFNTGQAFDWTQLQHLMNRDWMSQLLGGL